MAGESLQGSESNNPEQRLIVYGSLIPGGAYHFLLANLPGTWQQCVIRGRISKYRGYESFQYGPQGPEYAAWLFTSPALPGKFPELDAFEGEGYRRIVIPAEVGRRRVLAQIYEGKYGD